MGMVPEHYTQIQNDLTSTWFCPHCDPAEEAFFLTNTVDSSPVIDDSINKTLQELQLEVSSLGDSIENNTSENTLRIAAEIGSALLQQNTQLKDDSAKINSKILELEAEVELQKQHNETISERLEEAIRELIEKDKQLERTLIEKEKLQAFFIEHDSEQLQCITKHEETKKNVRNNEPTNDMKSEISSLIARFQTMECRINTLERQAVVDKADIQVLRKSLIVSSAEQTKRSCTFEHVMSSEFKSKSVNVTAGRDQIICKINSADTLNSGYPQEKPANNKPPNSARLLKSKDNLEDLLNHNIDSNKLTTRSPAKNPNISSSASFGKGHSTRQESKYRQPPTNTSHRDQKCFLDKSRDWKDRGRPRQESRVYINSSLKRSSSSIRMWID
ncbi:hypothetical protein J6590_066116 [Homalodisca vitripennis]|nr:hypothetical protein J6590_066116 [Homalodisca vitripennis]